VLAPISYKQAIACILGAVVSFHLAFTTPWAGFFAGIQLFCLFHLTRAPSMRVVFYPALAMGMAMYGPQLGFFWGIFGQMAGALWLLLALWLTAFLVLARFCVTMCRGPVAVALVPLLWTGLEYARCELYYLRFSWLIPGYSFATDGARLPQHLLGMYGVGLAMMLAVGLLALMSGKARWPAHAVALLLLAVLTNLPAPSPPTDPDGPQVVGIQIEGVDSRRLVQLLDDAVAAHPDADLFVLPEYTLDYGVPERVRDWCRAHRKHLIVGSLDYPVPDEPDFYNTAFVVGPEGEVVFKQVKAVPIQFFKDGKPAPTQQVWDSPWGPIGICICYDLSYTRVTDELIRQGAVALIVPTMDASSWGRHEHELHARVAPTRATEYGIPIFRLATSGISQAVNRYGTITDMAPFPGQGERIEARLDTGRPGRRPLDRWLAPAATAVAAGWLVAVGPLWWWRRRTHQKGE